MPIDYEVVRVNRATEIERDPAWATPLVLNRRVTAAYTSDATKCFTGFNNALISCWVDLVRGPIDATLTVVVQQSVDGNSWTSIATFNYSYNEMVRGGGNERVLAATPFDQLRVIATPSVGSEWVLESVTAIAGIDPGTGLVGPPGPQGPAGQAENWMSGAGVPTAGTGVANDWYLNTSTGDVYEKTDASTWTLRANIRGPQGIQGIQGPQGPSGGSNPAGPAGGVLDGSYPNPGLAAGVAGNGLVEISDVLQVNTDNITIEISADALRVKDAGITDPKLNIPRLAAIAPYSNNFNTATSNGWYYGDGNSANAPVGGSYWALQTLNITATNSGRQLAYQHATNNIYSRYQVGGSWGAWVQVYPPTPVAAYTSAVCLLRQTTPQAINNNSWAWLVWHVADKDPTGMWNGTHQHIAIVPEAGVYHVSFQFEMDVSYWDGGQQYALMIDGAYMFINTTLGTNKNFIEKLVNLSAGQSVGIQFYNSKDQTVYSQIGPLVPALGLVRVA